FFYSSRRRHTRFSRDWSSDVCSSDLVVFKVRVNLPKLVVGTRAVIGFGRVVEDLTGTPADKWMVGTGTREPKEAAVRPVGVEVGQFGSVRGSNPCRRHVRMPQAMVDDGLRVIDLGINVTPRGELISHGRRSDPHGLT